jgi:glycosyltransferase involved in cell wall biosynthesis
LCATHIFWKNGREACQKADCLTCCLRSRKPPQLWRYNGMRDSSLRHVDMLLSPSEYTARRHRDGGIQQPIRVLPTYSPIDPGPIASSRGPAEPRFLFAGRVTASKGIDDLVRLFTGLPQFHLDIVGDGDLLQTLKTECAGSPWIHFHGPVKHSDLPRFYREATAIVLPSKAPEVFPLTVLEAFACGTPAIVSDAGGSPEAVLKSGAGFVFKNPAELIQALTAMAGQTGLRNELSGLARAAFENYYSEDRYVSEYLTLAAEAAAHR